MGSWHVISIQLKLALIISCWNGVENTGRREYGADGCLPLGCTWAQRTKKPASARRDQVNKSPYQSLMLAAELLEARNLQACTCVVLCPITPFFSFVR